MAKIQFDDGTTLEFDGVPTDAQAQEAYSQFKGSEKPKGDFFQRAAEATKDMPGAVIGEKIGTAIAKIGAPKGVRDTIGSDFTTGQLLGDVAQSAASVIPIGRLFKGASTLAKAANYGVNVLAGYGTDVAANVVAGEEKVGAAGFGTAIAAGLPVAAPILRGAAGLAKGAARVVRNVVGATPGLLTDSADVLANKRTDTLINRLFRSSAGSVDAGTAAIAKQKVKNGADILREFLDEGFDLPVEGKIGQVGESVADGIASGTIPSVPYKPGTKLTVQQLGYTIKNAANKLVQVARSSVEAARDRKINVNTDKAFGVLFQVLNANKSRTQVNAANEMIEILDSYRGDPVKIFDWVQDANKNFGSDAARASVANDVAAELRTALDVITDRKAYGDGYSSIMEYKRAFVAAAKKANKKLDYIDLASDIAIDAYLASQFANVGPGIGFAARNTAGKLFAGLSNQKDFDRLGELIDLSRTSGRTAVAPRGVVRLPPDRQLPAGRAEATPTTGVGGPITKPVVDFVTDPAGTTMIAQKGIQTDVRGNLINPKTGIQDIIEKGGAGALAVGGLALGASEADASTAKAKPVAVKDPPDPVYKPFVTKRLTDNPTNLETGYRDIGTVDKDHIRNAIKTYESLFPNDKVGTDGTNGFSITEAEIQALYNKESSAGVDDSDSGDKTRYKAGYTWLYGIEDATINSILKSTKKRDKTIAPYLKNINTPEKAAIAAVLIWRMKKVISTEAVDDKGKKTGGLAYGGARDTTATYDNYSGGNKPEAVKEYAKMLKTYE